MFVFISSLLYCLLGMLHVTVFCLNFVGVKYLQLLFERLDSNIGATLLSIELVPYLKKKKVFILRKIAFILKLLF